MEEVLQLVSHSETVPKDLVYTIKLLLVFLQSHGKYHTLMACSYLYTFKKQVTQNPDTQYAVILEQMQHQSLRLKVTEAI